VVSQRTKVAPRFQCFQSQIEKASSSASSPDSHIRGALETNNRVYIGETLLHCLLSTRLARRKANVQRLVSEKVDIPPSIVLPPPAALCKATLVVSKEDLAELLVDARIEQLCNSDEENLKFECRMLLSFRGSFSSRENYLCNYRLFCNIFG
jgi:hypothetical protein